MEITFIALAILSLFQISSKNDIESLRGCYSLLLTFAVGVAYINKIAINNMNNLYLSIGLVLFTFPVFMRLYNIYSRNRKEI
jgi:FtsH-binding integral membrane protein